MYKGALHGFSSTAEYPSAVLPILQACPELFELYIVAISVITLAPGPLAGGDLVAACVAGSRNDSPHPAPRTMVEVQLFKDLNYSQTAVSPLATGTSLSFSPGL